MFKKLNDFLILLQFVVRGRLTRNRLLNERDLQGTYLSFSFSRIKTLGFSLEKIYAYIRYLTHTLDA